MARKYYWCFMIDVRDFFLSKFLKIVTVDITNHHENFLILLGPVVLILEGISYPPIICWCALFVRSSKFGDPDIKILENLWLLIWILESTYLASLQAISDPSRTSILDFRRDFIQVCWLSKRNFWQIIKIWKNCDCWHHKSSRVLPYKAF